MGVKVLTILVFAKEFYNFLGEVLREWYFTMPDLRDGK